jgi:hypothetical protein
MALSFVGPNRLLVMVLFSAGLQLLEHQLMVQGLLVGSKGWRMELC